MDKRDGSVRTLREDRRLCWGGETSVKSKREKRHEERERRPREATEKISVRGERINTNNIWRKTKGINMAENVTDVDKGSWIVTNGRGGKGLSRPRFNGCQPHTAETKLGLKVSSTVAKCPGSKFKYVCSFSLMRAVNRVGIWIVRVISNGLIEEHG